MAMRISPTLMMPVALGSVVVAFLLFDRAPAEGAPTGAATPELVAAADKSDMAPTTGEALPPNHPPIGLSPHGQGALVPGGEGAEPAAIRWTVPPEWKALPSTSAMRLATYRVGDAAELTVVRAGGSTDANVQRWLGQFDDGARSARQERTVHGLEVIVVRIAGTFAGGGMGSPAQPHPGWAMLAAIVQSPGTPYFFKVVGPAEQVDVARPAFERMLDGIAPAPPAP